jgi:hypothetical protein
MKNIAETLFHQQRFGDSSNWKIVFSKKPLKNSSYLGDRLNSSPADRSNKPLVMMTSCRRRRYRYRPRSSGGEQKTRRFTTTLLLLLSQLIIGVTSVRYIDVIVVIRRTFVAETNPAEYHKA